MEDRTFEQFISRVFMMEAHGEPLVSLDQQVFNAVRDAFFREMAKRPELYAFPQCRIH